VVGADAHREERRHKGWEVDRAYKTNVRNPYFI
jgi:hypothetical protein